MWQRRGSAWYVLHLAELKSATARRSPVQLYGPFNSYSRAVYAELIPPVSLFSDTPDR